MILLQGKPIKEKIEKEALKIVHELRKKGIFPHLAVILVGHREDSELYVAIKKKRAHELGMDFSLYRFEEDEPESSVIETINFLNEDESIHGIIIQLPLPENYNSDKVIATINENKDVDNLREKNIFPGPSSNAILKIIDEYKIETQGKKIVIVGRGKLVGKPLEKLLRERKLEVVSVDEETKDLVNEIKKADILITATGTPDIITEDLVRKDSVIISVGNEVNFERVKDLVEAITPPIGGVGPITVALLLQNTIIAAKKLVSDPLK